MEQFRRPEPSISLDPGKNEQAGEQTEASIEASLTPCDQIVPETSDSIENLLECYNFQYIFERVKQTIRAFPILQNLVEEITSEVYDKFWQRLRRGPIENHRAYIGSMIHNRCIDHTRRFINEKCHLVQSYCEGDLDILEINHVTASTEGLRDPAEEYEYKVAKEECYRRITAAIAELAPRQQQAAVWHLLRHVDDPQFLLEQFKDFDIALPILNPGNKDEEHLLDASYNHAKKFLARRLKIDLSQFKRKKHCRFRSQEIKHAALS